MWTDILEPLDIHKIDYPAKNEILGYGHGFEIETLLFTRAARSGLRVVEISSVEFERIHGASNLQTFVDGWRVLKCIGRERMRYYPIHTTEQHIRSENPLHPHGSQ